MLRSLVGSEMCIRDSNLLPGHGGVLDRIDALIPALPLAVLIDFWL